MEVVSTNETIEKSELLPVPASELGRFYYFLIVTVLPIVCFWMAASSLKKNLWQSGEISDYISFFFIPEAGWMFFPLIVYSSLSVLLLLADPSRYANKFWVRTGIYTGTLLALQYAIILLMLLDLELIFIVWIVPLIVLVIYRLVKNKWGTIVANSIFIALLGIPILWVLGQSGGFFVFSFLGLIGFIAIPAAPFWVLLVMGSTSYRLLRDYETQLTLSRVVGIAAWLAGFAVAWRLAIMKILELYAALPTTPPDDCYIATASAQGHVRIVQSRVVELEGGQRMKVTAQLQRLKCAELSLLAVAPRAHKILRSIYDIVGKSLARKIRTPFVADLAYLSLKPFEWIAWSTLTVIAPQIEEISSRFYASK